MINKKDFSPANLNFLYSPSEFSNLHIDSYSLGITILELALSFKFKKIFHGKMILY